LPSVLNIVLIPSIAKIFVELNKNIGAVLLFFLHSKFKCKKLFVFIVSCAAVFLL